MLTHYVTFARAFVSFAGKRAAVAAGLVLAGALLESVGVLLIVPFLELYSGPPQSALAVATAGVLSALGLISPQAQLLSALAFLLVLVLLRSAIIWARDVRLVDLTTGFVDDWRRRIFHALAGAPWPKITVYARSDVEHAITNDVVRIAQGTDRILRGGAGLVILVTQLIIAFVLSPMLTALVVCFMAVAAWKLVPLIGKARFLGQQLTRAGRGVHSVLGQFLSGLKLAKTHGVEQNYVAQFDARLAEMRGQILGFAREQAASQAVFQSILGLMVCAVIAIGALVFVTPVPVLTAILIIMARLSGPFLELLRGMQAFSYMMPAFEVVRDLAADLGDQEVEPRTARAKGSERGLPTTSGPAQVALDDVHFRHPGQSASVLRGVSLTIEPGEVIAIVGPSGAGKTTLVDIMTGLLTPTSGTVTIDGARLTGAVLQRWRQELAYVPQDPFLFDLSLRENLLWAGSQSSDDELWQALEMAGAGGFVRGLERGLDNRVGERGQALSGGERQRICLARALLRRPRMLILDEAMNAVDVELERRLLKVLAKLSQQTTVLIVTHRLASLEGIATVFALRAGCINEVDAGGSPEAVAANR